MRALLRGLLRHGLVQNVIALYGVQIANYVFPLITLPYLTRVLGPTSWGLLMIVQSFAQYLVIVVDFGFNLSATRAVAQHRDNKAYLAELLAGVTGAKGLLSVLAVLLAFVAYKWVPNMRENAALLASGVFWAVAWGYSPVWFFQGLERLRFVALLELLTRAFALVLIFWLVRSPTDAWKVLFAQGLTSALASGVAMALAWKEVGFALPSKVLIKDAFVSGFSLFFFRAAVSLYTVGNTFILGLIVSPQHVAYYAGAERLTKAFLGMLEPINRALLPRLSNLADYSLTQAARLARVSALVMGLSGVAFTGAVVLFAPLLVRLLLGPGFEPAVPLMRILALLLPLIALNLALGLQWMVALGLDRTYNWITVGAGLLNVGLALLLVPLLGVIGMAWVAVLAEALIAVAVSLCLQYLGKAPWQLTEAS